MDKRYTWQIRDTFEFATRFSEWETYGVAEYTLRELFDRLRRSDFGYNMSSVMMIDDGEFMVVAMKDRWAAKPVDYMVHFKRED